MAQLVTYRRRAKHALVRPGEVMVPRRDAILLFQVRLVVFDGTWVGYERGASGVRCVPDELYVQGVLKQVFRLRFSSTGSIMQLRFEDDAAIPGWPRVAIHWADERPWAVDFGTNAYTIGWDTEVRDRLIANHAGRDVTVQVYPTDNPVGQFAYPAVLPNIPALVSYLQGEGWNAYLTGDKSFFVQYDGGFHWTRDEVAVGAYQSAPGALVSDINDGLVQQGIPVP